MEKYPAFFTVVDGILVWAEPDDNKEHFTTVFTIYAYVGKVVCYVKLTPGHFFSAGFMNREFVKLIKATANLVDSELSKSDNDGYWESYKRKYKKYLTDEFRQSVEFILKTIEEKQENHPVLENNNDQ